LLPSSCLCSHCLCWYPLWFPLQSNCIAHFCRNERYIVYTKRK
jgi:hypothetical protein